MEIFLVEDPTDKVVGWEAQFGEREGKSFIAPSAAVIYQHNLDERLWSAGHNVDQFRLAARAWNHYSSSVAGQSESRQAEAVTHLHARLEEIGVLSSNEEFWDVVLGQAIDGHL